VSRRLLRSEENEREARRERSVLLQRVEDMARDAARGGSARPPRHGDAHANGSAANNTSSSNNNNASVYVYRRRRFFFFFLNTITSPHRP
jgi:hypothetical protein